MSETENKIKNNVRQTYGKIVSSDRANNNAQDLCCSNANSSLESSCCGTAGNSNEISIVKFFAQ